MGEISASGLSYMLRVDDAGGPGTPVRASAWNYLTVETAERAFEATEPMSRARATIVEFRNCRAIRTVRWGFPDGGVVVWRDGQA